MSESNLWKQMKKNIGHKGHFSRVESHSTSAGIPDVDFCIGSVEGHIELKFSREKILKCTFIRPTQVKWFRDRVEERGRPWLFALLIIGGEDHYLLFRGDKVNELYVINDPKKWVVMSDYSWHGYMDWNLLAKILRHGH